MITPIDFSDIEIEPAPSPEELERLRKGMVDRIAFGNYVDEFAIPGAPKELRKQWAKFEPEEHMRLLSLGYKMNPALARKSNFITSEEDGIPKIKDVTLYTIREEVAQAREQAVEIAKQLRADPRKTYSDVAGKLYGKLGVGPAGEFKPLDDKEVSENNTVRHLNLAETELELYKDKQDEKARL